MYYLNPREFVIPMLPTEPLFTEMPLVGEEIKSSMIVYMVRFSADIIALDPPTTLYVMSKLPTLDEPPDMVYELVPSLVMWIIDYCAAAGSIVVMRVAATAIAVITGIKTAIFWGYHVCGSVVRKYYL
jgi:hypothetical protein